MVLGARRAALIAGILLSFLSPVGTARADDSALRVDYDPPQISVEAREVSLGAVLRAIGAKVGFSVVEIVPSSSVVTLSIQNAPLDDVLRQLLRPRNHTMIYRVAEGSIAESGPIDKIVLFGDSATATAAVTPPEGSSQEPRQQQDQGDAGAKAVTLAQPASPQPWPESMPVLNLPTVDTGDPAAPSMSIGEMLRAHAMAGVQGGQLAGTGASFPAPAASQPASSPPPAPVDATLAETTRRAQQSLGALIDGLAAATRSLQQSLPTGRQ